MELIKGKIHLAGEYYWIRDLTNPQKFLQHATNVSDIVCAVAGTRALIHNNTIYGRQPNRAGVFSFYTRSDGIYELARATDGIFYYWERDRTKLSIKNKKAELPSMNGRGRGQKPHDEPWHDWNDQTIHQHIIEICEAMVYDKLSVEEACELHGLTHWGFESLFQYTWPLKYYEWKKNKTIPTTDQHTFELVQQPTTVSSAG